MSQSFRILPILSYVHTASHMCPSKTIRSTPTSAYRKRRLILPSVGSVGKWYTVRLYLIHENISEQECTTFLKEKSSVTFIT